MLDFAVVEAHNKTVPNNGLIVRSFFKNPQNEGGRDVEQAFRMFINLHLFVPENDLWMGCRQGCQKNAESQWQDEKKSIQTRLCLFKTSCHKDGQDWGDLHNLSVRDCRTPPPVEPETCNQKICKRRNDEGQKTFFFRQPRKPFHYE